MENVCKFIPTKKAPDTIDTINFVLETSNTEKKEKVSTLYRINYVLSGTGKVVQNGITREVSHGDVFFIFPATTFSIEGGEDFSYVYVSFIGLRANVLMERFGITKRNFHFTDFFGVEEFWLKNLELSQSVMDIASESVVLYTLSTIGDRRNEGLIEEKTIGEKFICVKKYVDDNFSDPELSVSAISREFCYNRSYLSYAFKKHFKTSISEYITTVRINQACMLMEKNYKGVSDIAFLCGYKDSMYFSKVFRQKMGISPREYISKVSQSLTTGENSGKI